MPWDRVHDEAEVLEHYISEELEQRIAKRLGDPLLDPHGDPIPDADLDLPVDQTIRLADLEPGVTATFTRISDSDPAMLRYLGGLGIHPGAELRVVAREPFDGPQRVEIGGAVRSLGGQLCRAMRVSVPAAQG